MVLMLNKVGDALRQVRFSYLSCEQTGRYPEEKAPSRHNGQEIVRRSRSCRYHIHLYCVQKHYFVRRARKQV